MEILMWAKHQTVEVANFLSAPLNECNEKGINLSKSRVDRDLNEKVF